MAGPEGQMKLMINRLAAVSLAAVLASAAFAAEKENPFSARVGIFWPTSSDTRSQTKNTGFNAGISYQLPNINMGAYSNASWGLDLDGTWVGSSGNKLEAYDLLLTGRWMTTGLKAGQMSFYYGLGVGLSRMKADTTTTTTVSNGSGGSTTTTTNNSESKTSIAGKLILGTMLSKQAFAELGFRIAPSVGGINTNGLSLQVGIKF